MLVITYVYRPKCNKIVVENICFSNSIFLVDNLIKFSSPFAKHTNQPYNPNFAKKLINLAYALAIFTNCFGWHSVSVRHMVS